MAPVFIQLRIGQQPGHHCATLFFFHSICEGNTLKFAFNTWQMRLLSSRDAGKAWLNEVQTVWLRVRRRMGILVLPHSFLIKPTCWGSCPCWYRFKKNEARIIINLKTRKCTASVLLYNTLVLLLSLTPTDQRLGLRTCLLWSPACVENAN